MFGASRRRSINGVEIRLDIDTTSPLAGAVTADGRTSDFGGWLGLLRVLSDTLTTAADAGGYPPRAEETRHEIATTDDGNDEPHERRRR